MVMLLGAEAIRRHDRRWTIGAVAAGVLFYSFALWMVPHGDGTRHELNQSVGEMALSAVYPVAGAVFLTVAGVVTASAWRRRPPVRTTPRSQPAYAGR
jgi:hypothetical protein